MPDPLSRAEVIIEALPYIRAFHGKMVVVKYGGNAMVDPALTVAVMQDLILMALVGMRPVVVHGGGPQIDQAMKSSGLKPNFVQGLRITDPDTMRIVERVLVGEINQEIVAGITRLGGSAIGLSGKDGGMVQARKAPARILPDGQRVDLGLVGEVVRVTPRPLETLLQAGYIPVVAPTAGDDAAMEVVKMVLVGKVNKELVAAINSHGRLAVGIAGDDANLIKARPVSERLGRVGEVESVDTTVVTNLIEDGFIPVIATVGYGDDGGSYNINADLVAGEIAAALQAEKLVLLTDTDGILDARGALLSTLTREEVDRLVAETTISKGMLPKVAACRTALCGGVRKTHIINGTRPHALLEELLTAGGVGTEILP